RHRHAPLLSDAVWGQAGRAMIDEAKRDGSWTLLDDVENLVVPDDLAAALDAHPGARDRWEGLSRSGRRAALEQMALGKGAGARAARLRERVRRPAVEQSAREKPPETRPRRVAETPRLTAEGERPGR